MGIRLSSSGGLTNSQKATCKNPADETKLLDKLSGMSTNKPILEAIKTAQREKTEKAKESAMSKATAKIRHR